MASHIPKTLSNDDRQFERPSSTRKEALLARRAESRALASDPLLTAREAAAETGRAISTFWRDVRRGTLPQPYYVTPHCPRWRQSELRDVVANAPRGPGVG